MTDRVDLDRVDGLCEQGGTWRTRGVTRPEILTFVDEIGALVPAMAAELRAARDEIECLRATVVLVKRALRLAAGELSCYRDTDQHPDLQYTRLMREAAGDEHATFIPYEMPKGANDE